jgi:hypothetical protein
MKIDKKVNTMKLYDEVKSFVNENTKNSLSHICSLPVIKRVDERMYIACYIFYKNPDAVEEGSGMFYPAEWAGIDIKNGKDDIRLMPTGMDIGFYLKDEKYLTANNSAEMWSVLDDICTDVCALDIFDMKRYHVYQSIISTLMPADIARFVISLGISLPSVDRLTRIFIKDWLPADVKLGEDMDWNDAVEIVKFFASQPCIYTILSKSHIDRFENTSTPYISAEQTGSRTFLCQTKEAAERLGHVIGLDADGSRVLVGCLDLQNKSKNIMHFLRIMRTFKIHDVGVGGVMEEEDGKPYIHNLLTASPFAILTILNSDEEDAYSCQLSCQQYNGIMKDNVDNIKIKMLRYEIE